MGSNEMKLFGWSCRYGVHMLLPLSRPLQRISCDSVWAWTDLFSPRECTWVCASWSRAVPGVVQALRAELRLRRRRGAPLARRSLPLHNWNNVEATLETQTVQRILSGTASKKANAKKTDDTLTPDTERWAITLAASVVAPALTVSFRRERRSVKPGLARCASALHSGIKQICATVYTHTHTDVFCSFLMILRS